MPSFEPPVVDTVPPLLPSTTGPVRALMAHYKTRACGVTVLKTGATYTQKQYPTQAEIDAADVVYLGGHVYQIDDTEAAALTAAGYGSQIT